MIKKAFKAAFPKTIPIMAGYLVLGIGFGVLLQSAGYNFIWAFLMSITIYAGSMQYVAVDLLSSGATLISAAIMTLMVQARHLFYGISLLKKYKNMGKSKPYLIFGLTDETYSLACSTDPPEGVDRRFFYFFITLLDHCYWICGCVLGNILGDIIPFDATGIEFAMTSLFVVIFVDQWLNSKNHISAMVGVLSALVCLIIFGPENFIIPAMITIVIALAALKKPLSKEETPND